VFRIWLRPIRDLDWVTHDLRLLCGPSHGRTRETRCSTSWRSYPMLYRQWTYTCPKGQLSIKRLWVMENPNSLPIKLTHGLGSCILSHLLLACLIFKVCATTTPPPKKKKLWGLMINGSTSMTRKSWIYLYL
jgi:hypothetical protein